MATHGFHCTQTVPTSIKLLTTSQLQHHNNMCNCSQTIWYNLPRAQCMGKCHQASHLDKSMQTGMHQSWWCIRWRSFSQRGHLIVISMPLSNTSNTLHLCWTMFTWFLKVVLDLTAKETYQGSSQVSCKKGVYILVTVCGFFQVLNGWEGLFPASYVFVHHQFFLSSTYLGFSQRLEIWTGLALSRSHDDAMPCGLLDCWIIMAAEPTLKGQKIGIVTVGDDWFWLLLMQVIEAQVEVQLHLLSLTLFVLVLQSNVF